MHHNHNSVFWQELRTSLRRLWRESIAADLDPERFAARVAQFRREQRDKFAAQGDNPRTFGKRWSCYSREIAQEFAHRREIVEHLLQLFQRASYQLAAAERQQQQEQTKSQPHPQRMSLPTS